MTNIAKLKIYEPTQMGSLVSQFGPRTEICIVSIYKYKRHLYTVDDGGTGDILIHLSNGMTKN